MAVDMFIKMTDVQGVVLEGESKDKAHKNEIEILSYSFGVENPTTIGSATGGAGGGKANFKEFNFTNHTQKSTPKLLKAMVTGDHYKEALLSVRKASSNNDFYKLTLGTVFVTSLQQGASDGDSDDAPTESITFVFGTFLVQYRQQLPGGAFSEWFEARWDQVQNNEGSPPEG